MFLKSFKEFILEKKKAVQLTSVYEGGAFGHMAHIYEDLDLTFAQIKHIIDLALSGELNKEEEATEKLDGQALAISWKDGKLIAARNKTDRKNFGASAPDAQGIINKFDGRGELSDAFKFAVLDLQDALSKIGNSKLEDIFDNGKKFMHLEIIYPGTTNVISYDAAKLFFHSVTEYDEDGEPVSDDKKAASQLYKVIKDVNADLQKTYHISPPASINLPKHIDFDEKKSYFLNKLDKIQSEAGLPDEASIQDYVRFKFMELVDAKDRDGELNDIIINGLLNRWANFDKSFNIRKVDMYVKNQDIKNWIIDFDKKDAADSYKKFIEPLEHLILELGSVILKNASGFLAANPDSAVQKIRQEIERTAREIENSNDITKMNKLQTQLAKIDAIGGFNAIVPSEGIVFVYNGKTYKLTGAFAPVNQITGMLKFG